MTRPSLLAIASTLLGALGFFTCCCAFIGIPTSLLAVVTGHLALIFINRPNSNLSGKAFAAIGLIAGYCGLLISGGFLAVGLLAPDKPAGDLADANAAAAAPRDPTANDLLNKAEDSIRTDSGGIADGNSDEARELAREFSEMIQTLREALFTKDGGGISLSGDKFLTYCELRDGQCAFVVHVPDYRKFEGEAKESLADLAWMAAQKTVADKLQPGDKLAVGMKGVVFYGSVMVGQVADPEGEDDGLESNTNARPNLLPFFEPEKKIEEPVGDGLIELPAEMDEPAMTEKPEGEQKLDPFQPAESVLPSETPASEPEAPANEASPVP